MGLGGSGRGGAGLDWTGRGWTGLHEKPDFRNRTGTSTSGRGLPQPLGRGHPQPNLSVLRLYMLAAVSAFSYVSCTLSDPKLH